MFRKTLGVFDTDTNYNVILKEGNCDDTDEACTNGTDPKNIVITLENVKQHSLGIAAAILHEGLHAELHRYVDQAHNGSVPKRRGRILQLYAYYKGWSDTYNDEDYNWKNDADHVYFIENYVVRIAKAVRSVHNNKYPLDYYMAYGWDGLRKTGYDIKKLDKDKDKYYSALRAKMEIQEKDDCKV
ncbi:MAG: hypothetical protein OIF50_11245 [Flavobacteriaceae bacterium]|nr:hypothetical protein [Flavobacteriaceae bacterium]